MAAEQTDEQLQTTGRHTVDRRRLQSVPGRHRVIGTGTKSMPVRVIIHYEKEDKALSTANHKPQPLRSRVSG